jgi:four helix bundle protein
MNEFRINKVKSMDEYFSYRKLRVYQQAKDLVIYVYRLMSLFPKEEQYALCDQLRRAVISVPSNIAEGMGRVSVKEQVHFIEIAFGSLNEVMCQLELARELNYISDIQLKDSEVLVKSIAQMLSGLRNSKRETLVNR